MRLEQRNDAIDDGSSSDKLEAILGQVPDSLRAWSSELLLWPWLKTSKWSLELVFCKARWRVAVEKDILEEPSFESTVAKHCISRECSANSVWEKQQELLIKLLDFTGALHTPLSMWRQRGRVVWGAVFQGLHPPLRRPKCSHVHICILTRHAIRKRSPFD